MNKRIVKNNIKKTLFFSYSVIFSTLFFLTFLYLKNECRRIDKEIRYLEDDKHKYSNNLKSLKRKRDLLVRNVEDIASENYSFVIPDPLPFIIFTDTKE